MREPSPIRAAVPALIREARSQPFDFLPLCQPPRNSCQDGKGEWAIMCSFSGREFAAVRDDGMMALAYRFGTRVKDRLPRRPWRPMVHGRNDQARSLP